MRLIIQAESQIEARSPIKARSLVPIEATSPLPAGIHLVPVVAEVGPTGILFQYCKMKHRPKRVCVKMRTGRVFSVENK